MKTALITGITGQDGAYLAELLLRKGYEVHGIIRRASQFNTARIDHLYQDPHDLWRRLFLHFGDMTDAASLFDIVQKVRPDELYNLAAQSHVQVSFAQDMYTYQVNGVGLGYLLTAIRMFGLEGKTKVYQASTSELFGVSHDAVQSETTLFNPQSPYATSKRFAHDQCVMNRNAYGMYICSGILFNHESETRGKTFVTRKISCGLSRIKAGLDTRLILGNLDAKRDWGHARDYVEAQWMMMQQEVPGDYVIASGRQHSVRQFVDSCANILDMPLEWRGSGEEEEAIDDNGNVVISIDKAYFRKQEVHSLLGDASLAKRKLGWVPRTSFEEMVRRMVEHDLREAQRDALAMQHGFRPFSNGKHGAFNAQEM